MQSSYRGKRHKKKIPISQPLARVVLVAEIFSVFFWLLTSSNFTITNTHAGGSELVSDEDIRAIVNDFYSKSFTPYISYKNIFVFFVFQDQIRDKAISFFPEIRSVDISIDSLNSVSVALKDRTEVGIWCNTDAPPLPELEELPNINLNTSTTAAFASSTPERIVRSVDNPSPEICLYFDDEYIPFREAPQAVGSLLPFILDTSNTPLNRGDELQLRQQIQFIQNINEGLRAIDVRPIRYTLDVAQVDVQVDTKSQGYMLFDSLRNAHEQVTATKAVLEEKIDSPQLLEYIDVRVPNRAYFKYKTFAEPVENSD